MSQLEMVYLMKVSLHLNTMNDVMEFEKINKKSTITICSLKVNPWFKTKNDIEKFNQIFKPTTCNCNGLQIGDSILLKAERIRNYPFGTIYPGILSIPENINKVSGEEEKKHSIAIISKLESIKTNKIGTEQEFELLIQNSETNLKIQCEYYFFIYFERAYRKLKEMESQKKESKYEKLFYPKQIIIQINFLDKVDIKRLFDSFQKSNQDNIICVWDRIYSEIKIEIISSQVKNYITYVDLELLEKNKNVVLMINNEEGSFNVLLEDIFEEKNRIKCFDLINKVYATKINLLNETYDSPLGGEKIKLPKCVKEIEIFSYFDNFILPFTLEGIEVLKQNGISEINEKNDLKVLELKSSKEISYESEKGLKKRQKWGNENTIDYFLKLTKLYLFNCKNIEILSKLKNIEYLTLNGCESCNIDIDSKNLRVINLYCHKSLIKLKIYKNDVKFIISDCRFVDIEIESESESEEGIKPNIDITNCTELKIKSTNEMGNIIIEESNNISFNEGFKCELIQLNNSQTTNKLIEANVVRLNNVLRKCPINLNKAKEIVVVNMNNFILEGMFESCKKLVISGCSECDFDLKNNFIEEIKVMKCKSTNIKGTLPNIKSFVSIENVECKIPITNNIITTDEEIIELNGDTKIVTDKKQLIIRNGKNVKCEIESLIKTDFLFENCENFSVIFKNRIFGSIEFNNCSAFDNNTSFHSRDLSIGSIDSLILNHSKNIKIYARWIFNLLKLKNSDLNLSPVDDMDENFCEMGNYLTINDIEIENSNLYLDYDISSNKCVIDNSKTSLDKIVNNCGEEVVLKRIKGINIGVSKQVEKITFEDCSKLQCPVNLKGKDVKLIRCSDMKLNDTSNSVKMESCQNIRVITQIQQIQQINNQPFGQPQNNNFDRRGFGQPQNFINQEQPTMEI